MITDEYMREMLTKSRTYSAVILKHGPQYDGPGADKIIWEHGRRNFSLRADGRLRVVCPIRDGTALAGIGIFDGKADEIDRLMREDPAVRAGLLTFELHPCRGFPGDAL